MKTSENINPRFLKLLKTPKNSKKKREKNSDLSDLSALSALSALFSTETKPPTPIVPPQEESLLLLAESDEGILKWIRRKTPEPEFKPALHLFNIINSITNPDGKLAKRLTLTVLKGTSFPDKRETCMEVVQRIRQGEHNGKILLVPCPYEDIHDPSRSDPWALKAVADGYPEEKFLGYIPKAQGLNHVFSQAIESNMFCGCHIIGAKHTDFKNEDNQILTVVCGWLNPQDTP